MICSGCGQGFLDVGGEDWCAGCEAERDPLVCRACGTRMLAPAETCGMCAPPSVYSRALDAMRCAA